MNKSLFFFLSLLVFPSIAEGQSFAVFAGSQVPLTYGTGLSFRLSGNFTSDIRFGILTKPYDVAILEILKALGTEEALTQTIGEAFSYGTSLQPGFSWHFGKNYLGLHYSWLFLVAREAPANAIENYYGLTLPGILPRERQFSLHSDLHNAGLLYGRRIPLKNERWEFRAEASLAKTFASGSKLNSDRYGELPLVSEIIDNTLDSYYLQYAWLPSINLLMSCSW